jgi:hypothetical protein
MRRHTEIGARIIAADPSLADVVMLVRAHHERYDGGGYPDGLVGGEVPFGACVIAVCAAFVAMMRTARTSTGSPSWRRSPSCTAAPAPSFTPRWWTSSTRSSASCSSDRAVGHPSSSTHKRVRTQHSDRADVGGRSHQSRTRAQAGAENGSGTDHGDGGVAFLIGTRAAGKMVGEFPGLTNLAENENLIRTSDFRGMYCSLLEQWFQTEAGLVIPEAASFERPLLVK